MEQSLFGDRSPIISEIISISRYTDGKAFYPFRQKGRRIHGLIFAVYGEERYTFFDDVMDTKEGDVFFLPKTIQYDISLKSDTCTVICIDFDTVNDLKVKHVYKPQKSGLLANLFFSAESVWRQKKDGYEAECMSIVYKILSELEKQSKGEYSSKENRNRIAPIVDYIRENYFDPELRVEQLATDNGIHPRYFSRIFKTVYGVSPKQYLTSLRMEKARELLLSNRYSITQISSMTGYADIYHFSKAFKKEYNTTAKEYKNRY